MQQCLALTLLVMGLAGCSPTIYEFTLSDEHWYDVACETYLWQPEHKVCTVYHNPSRWNDRPANVRLGQ